MEISDPRAHNNKTYPENTPSVQKFCQQELAQKLFERTWNHPELSKYLLWAPTEWLLDIANPNPFPYTNTAGADSPHDRWVDMPALYAGMLQQGMRDPLVLGIGLNGYVRLESGNQRVRCFYENDVSFVPVVGYVNDTAVTSTQNGVHEGLPLAVDMQAACASYGCFVRPSDILLDAPLY